MSNERTETNDQGPTIGVWIRHENQEKGRWFTRWPIGDLDNVIPVIGRWGLRDDDKGVEVAANDLFGTFVIADGIVRFEVMIADQVAEDD